MDNTGSLSRVGLEGSGNLVVGGLATLVSIGHVSISRLPPPSKYSVCFFSSISLG